MSTFPNNTLLTYKYDGEHHFGFVSYKERGADSTVRYIECVEQLVKDLDMSLIKELHINKVFTKYILPQILPLPEKDDELTIKEYIKKVQLWIKRDEYEFRRSFLKYLSPILPVKEDKKVLMLADKDWFPCKDKYVRLSVGAMPNTGQELWYVCVDNTCTEDTRHYGFEYYYESQEEALAIYEGLSKLPVLSAKFLFSIGLRYGYGCEDFDYV